LNISKNLLLFIAVATLVGFSLGGILIILQFQDVSLPAVFFRTPTPLYQQIVVGLLYGFITTMPIIYACRFKSFQEVTLEYSQMLPKDLSILEILFISLCVGVGEEIFFRAGMQPLWGVFVTSIFFVGIHFYYDFSNTPKLYYGFYLTIVIIGAAYLFEYMGIWAASAFHFMFDAILIWYLTRKVNPLSTDSKPI